MTLLSAVNLMFLVHPTLSPLLQHHRSFLLFGHLHRYPLSQTCHSLPVQAHLLRQNCNSDQMYFIPIVHLFLVQGAAGEEAGERAGEEAGEVAVPGGSPHALTAWTGLENTTCTLQRAGFWQEWLLGLWAGVWQPIVLTITCSLMSGCGQSHETAY